MNEHIGRRKTAFRGGLQPRFWRIPIAGEKSSGLSWNNSCKISGTLQLVVWTATLQSLQIWQRACGNCVPERVQQEIQQCSVHIYARIGSTTDFRSQVPDSKRGQDNTCLRELLGRLQTWQTGLTSHKRAEDCFYSQIKLQTQSWRSFTVAAVVNHSCQLEYFLNTAGKSTLSNTVRWMNADITGRVTRALVTLKTIEPSSPTSSLSMCLVAKKMQNIETTNVVVVINIKTCFNIVQWWLPYPKLVSDLHSMLWYPYPDIDVYFKKNPCPSKSDEHYYELANEWVHKTSIAFHLGLPPTTASFEEFQAIYWKESKQWDYVQASTVRCMIAILREDNQIQQSDNTWSCIKSSFQSCCIIM